MKKSGGWWKGSAQRFLAACLIALGSGGCGSETDSHDESLLTILIWNLDDFGLRDRDGDGQANDPVPRDQHERALRVFESPVRPEIAILQGMGGPATFDAFRRELSARGHDYPHHTLLDLGQEKNLALLSRIPLQARAHTNATYTIKNETFPVLRGFLEGRFELDGKPLHLINTHLKSKDFHPAGQNDMRRNEARLLSRLLREDRGDGYLLVCGTLNDDPHSQAVKSIRGEGAAALHDARPTLFGEDAWTWHDRKLDAYFRRDYPLMNSALHERLHGAVLLEHAETGSRYRPTVLKFRRGSE